MKLSLWLYLIGVISLTAQAELTIVADLGGNSTIDYFAGINDQRSQNASQKAEIIPLPMTIFPIHTPELTPGIVTLKTLNLPNMPPLFLIGDDELSHRWLLSRQAILRQLNAVGLVVNVTNQQALNTLKQQAHGLTLLPISGSDLAQRLGVKHYPFLLTDKGVEQ